MIKQFFKSNKKTIINLLILTLIVLLLSVVAAVILYAFDIINFDDGIQLNLSVFDKFKNSWYGWLIVLAAQVVLTTVLCFLPGTTMMFIVLIQTLYDTAWEAFLLSFTGVLLSSLIMYLTGKYGGRKLCEKVLGENDCERATNLLKHKGMAFFPVMMLFPMFPDDALVMIAGTLDMPLKWFIPSIVIGRGIGVATIVFGIGSIPYEKFTTPLHWILFILAAVAVLVGVFFLANKLNKYLDSKNSSSHNE